jgi:cysteinyl-tRNA synthetase
MGIRQDGVTFLGDNGPNAIKANGGSNYIFGQGGNDTIRALGGVDWIEGGKGDDTIDGGAGSDLIDSGRGLDVVFGGAGNDFMSGGRGADILTGGRGKDFFVFDAKPGPANVDVVTDFSVRDDTIMLDRSVFAKLAKPGVLSAKAFVAGDHALDAHDRIIYDPTTGTLAYDPDGTGARPALTFAQVSPALALTHKDFLIL